MSPEAPLSSRVVPEPAQQPDDGECGCDHGIDFTASGACPDVEARALCGWAVSPKTVTEHLWTGKAQFVDIAVLAHHRSMLAVKLSGSCVEVIDAVVVVWGALAVVKSVEGNYPRLPGLGEVRSRRTACMARHRDNSGLTATAGQWLHKRLWLLVDRGTAEPVALAVYGFADPNLFHDASRADRAPRFQVPKLLVWSVETTTDIDSMDLVTNVAVSVPEYAAGLVVADRGRVVRR